VVFFLWCFLACLPSAFLWCLTAVVFAREAAEASDCIKGEQANAAKVRRRINFFMVREWDS